MADTKNGIDCERCKSSILSHVRDIKDDLKEIVKEKATAVIEHLDDLIFQINKSLDEGSGRMTRTEDQISKIYEKINTEISTITTSATTEANKRRSFVYKFIMWSVGIALTYIILVAITLSGTHRGISQKIEDVKDSSRTQLHEHVLDCQLLRSRVTGLEKRIKKLEK